MSETEQFLTDPQGDPDQGEPQVQDRVLEDTTPVNHGNGDPQQAPGEAADPAEEDVTEGTAAEPEEDVTEDTAAEPEEDKIDVTEDGGDLNGSPGDNFPAGAIEVKAARPDTRFRDDRTGVMITSQKWVPYPKLTPWLKLQVESGMLEMRPIEE